MMLPWSHRINNCYQYRWKQMQVLVIWPLIDFTVKQVKNQSRPEEDQPSSNPLHCEINIKLLLLNGNILQSSFKPRSYLLSQPGDPPPDVWQRTFFMCAKFVLSVVSLGSASVVAWCVLPVGRFWGCETDAAQEGGSSARVVSTVTNSESLLWAGGWGNTERQQKSQLLSSHRGFSADQQSAMCDFVKQKETWMGGIWILPCMWEFPSVWDPDSPKCQLCGKEKQKGDTKFPWKTLLSL